MSRAKGGGINSRREPAMSEKNILIIDDQEISLTGIKRILKGYDVDCAKSGESALEMMKRKKYALAFVDFHMPGGMDGVETCRAMKEADPAMVVVFMTGSVEVDQVRIETEFIKAGGEVHWLCKPLFAEELLAVTRKALASRQK